MAFQPSKQQLDNDIPAACKAINAILVQLQKATGADDQFIARILEEDSRGNGGRTSTRTVSASADQPSGRWSRHSERPMLGHGYRLRRHPDFFGLHRRRLCDCRFFPRHR